MKRGRPVKAGRLVACLEGTEAAKRRLELILEATAGRLSVEQACRELAIRPSRFHAMRREVLQEALAALEPQSPGRHAVLPSESESRIAALQEQIGLLQREVQAAQIREELAIVLPGVLRPPEPRPGKKTRSKRKTG
jgi:hypothetical protein